MNSGKPLRKNVGRGEDQQMFILSNLTWVISSSPNKIAWPGGGRKVEAKWLAGALKRKWQPSPRRRKKREEMLVIGKGSWQTDP